MIGLAALALTVPQALTLEFKPPANRDNGKHVVLLAGEEEYRSEEMLPQLARILSQRQGFRCTVGFSLNEKGEIDPTAVTRQSGLEALERADVLVIMLRFRRWSDADMQRISGYLATGKPVVAIRTSTHAFDFPADSPFSSWSWNSAEGGFGRTVLGETWISHWGDHGKQATRGREFRSHPILRGVDAVFGTTDVYEAHPPSDAKVILSGEVVSGLNPGDPAATGRKRTSKGVEQGLNDPRMPIAWVREGRRRVFTTTMGAATDFKDSGFRRMLVNGIYWAADLPVPMAAGVDLIGEYKPSPFGFGGYRKGVTPSSLISGN